MSISSREIEMRATPCAVELRSAGSRRIGGYGAVYNRKSRPLGAFVEVIENRAFAKAEADHWAGVVSRLEHKPELLLGSVAGGSLDLRTDAKGLDYSVELPNTSAGNDTLALVTRGDIHNSSVAFQCYDDEFSYDGGDFPVRHLISVRVLDVSPTAQPAYPDATVGLRHLATQVGEDPADVLQLARQGELRSLFTRTDRQYVTVTAGSGGGGTTLVESRAIGMDLKTARAQLGSMKRKSITNKQRQLSLQKVRIDWDAPTLSVAEARAQLHEVRSWRQFDPRA